MGESRRRAREARAARAAKPARRATKPKRAATKPPRDAKPARAARRASRRPSMRFALFLVVLVGLLFAFVYPTRTFLDQRDQTNKARQQLEVLQSENARLAQESKRL